MSDPTNGLLTETDDDVVIVEESVEPVTEPVAEPPAPVPAPAPTAEDDDGDDDDGDSRIETGSDDDDADLDPAEAKRRKRLRRREIQRMARTRKDQQLSEQANLIEQMAARLQQMEQVTVASRAEQLDAHRQRLADDRARAQAIRAQALSASDGAKVNQIDDIIRQIDAEERDVIGQTDQIRQTLEQMRQQQPTKVPVGPQADTQAYAQAWMQQNQWFNPQGNDSASAITRQIDASVATDGFRPDTPEYWFELTRRINAAAKGSQQTQSGTKPTPPAPRSAATPPPIASGRSVADGGAVAGPKTFVLSAARKSAMIEAGNWDDPVRRKAQIAAFMAYDREQAARQK